ncbi:hypothetical protein [Methylomonas sp. DH-1]|uniref:hypothetical protein n=1 Tax=Methylomonas sp. (strain DH-1) TaxID=1727196 RepID=UPI000B28A138|nr:hypothetical protein [Methylomonas sp. DH-1]
MSLEDKKIVQRLLYLEDCPGLGNCSPYDPDLDIKINKADAKYAEYCFLCDELERVGPEYIALYYRLGNIKSDLCNYNSDNESLKLKIIKHL